MKLRIDLNELLLRCIHFYLQSIKKKKKKHTYIHIYSYWTFVLLTILVEYDGQTTISDLSQKTGIKLEDVISTLQALDLVKYWKGQYMIMVSREDLQAQLSLLKPPRVCDPAKLTWQPTAP
jgi:histone acetyltransferase MYST1